MERVIINLGSGSGQQPGAIGLDRRITPAVGIVCDATKIALRDNTVDELYSYCLLEHFERPQEVLIEVHRVIKPGGMALLRVPNIGTYAAHLDLTHRFLGDLTIWKEVIGGFFQHVKVRPIGTKYRDNPLLRAINVGMIKGLKFYELSEAWDFICTGPRPYPAPGYEGWWEEESFSY